MFILLLRPLLGPPRGVGHSLRAHRWYLRVKQKPGDPCGTFDDLRVTHLDLLTGIVESRLDGVALGPFLIENGCKFRSRVVADERLPANDDKACLVEGSAVAKRLARVNEDEAEAAAILKHKNGNVWA